MPPALRPSPMRASTSARLQDLEITCRRGVRATRPSMPSMRARRADCRPLPGGLSTILSAISLVQGRLDRRVSKRRRSGVVARGSRTSRASEARGRYSPFHRPRGLSLNDPGLASERRATPPWTAGAIRRRRSWARADSAGRRADRVLATLPQRRYAVVSRPDTRRPQAGRRLVILAPVTLASGATTASRSGSGGCGSW